MEKAAEAVIHLLPEPGEPPVVVPDFNPDFDPDFDFDPDLDFGPDPGRRFGRGFAYSAILKNEELFRAVAAKRPMDADLWLARFQRCASTRDWNGAESAAREVVKRRPDNVTTLRALAKTLALSPKPESAEEYYCKAVEHKPDDSELRMALCKLCIQIKKWDEAAAAFDTALRHSAAPGKPGLSATAIYNMLPQRPDVFEQFSERRPEDATLWLKWGQSLLAANKLTDALSALKKAAEFSKENPEVWMDLARVHIILKEWDNASEAMDKAIQNAAPPGKPGITADTVYQRLPLFAPEAIQELARRRPKDGHLWLVRGKQLAATNNMRGAVTFFTKATELLPQSTEAWTELARAHVNLSNVKDGAAAYDKALNAQALIPFPVQPPQPPQPPPPSKPPTNPSMLPPTLYSEIVGRSLNMPEARGLLQMVAELRPNDGRLWLEYSRAMGSVSAGNLLTAQRAEIRLGLDEMVKRSPKEPIAWLERANFRVRDGELDKAVEDYVAAAELFAVKPSLPPVGFKMYFDISQNQKLITGFMASRKDDPYLLAARGQRRSYDPLDSGWEADLQRAVALRPDDPYLRSLLRQAYLDFGQWPLAAKEYVAEFERQEPPPESLLWIEAAATYAAAGETHRYRAMCRRLEELWETHQNSTQRRQLVLATGLLPESGADAVKMLKIAQSATPADPRVDWNSFTLALAHCRLGEYEKAIAVARPRVKAMESLGYWPEDRVVVSLVLAVALARDGKKDEARSVFQAACKKMDEVLLVQGKRRRWGSGYVWAVATILRREAESLLNDKPAP